MNKINIGIKPYDLNGKIKKFWGLSAEKINLIEKDSDASKGSPVFTVKGFMPPKAGQIELGDFSTARLFYSMRPPEKNHFSAFS